jgi:hypothetical protein
VVASGQLLSARSLKSDLQDRQQADITRCAIPTATPVHRDVTVDLKQVKTTQHGLADGAVAVEGVEHGDGVRATDAGLAIDRVKTYGVSSPDEKLTGNLGNDAG